jgi:adenylate cyclase
MPANRSKVTLSDDTVESHIQKRIAAPARSGQFAPAEQVRDPAVLAQDYEKLRVSYELTRAIGAELNVETALNRILACALQIFPADRGVILLLDPSANLVPRCVRFQQESDHRNRDEEVIVSNTIVQTVVREKAAVLSADARVDARFAGAHSIIMQGIRSSMTVPLLYGDELLGVMLIDSHMAVNAFTEKDLELLQTLGHQAAVAIQNRLFAERIEHDAWIQQRFQRLLSPEIAEQVLSGAVEIQQGGEVRETTMLFADIRGFTSMSESTTPESIVELLNAYFEQMVEVIFRHEGTLDKFVGDGVMALFGAPIARPDDAERAVHAAWDMQRQLRRFNDVLREQNRVPLSIGIGINTGNVVAGFLGSTQILEYTVIGDAVNVGARLCELAKPDEVLISVDTWHRVRDHVEAERIAPTYVKGKTKPVEIYRVLNVRDKLRSGLG